MREIKFRAWNKDEKKMIYSPAIDSNDGADKSFVSFWSYVEDNTVYKGDIELMQYTGLKDKNGTEIYEGDILKNTKHKDQLVEVYWKGCFTNEDSVNGSHWIQWGGWAFRKVISDDTFTYAVYDNQIEVVGNIYENPELTK